MDKSSAVRDHRIDIDNILHHHQASIDIIITTLSSQVSNLASQQNDIADIKSTLRQLSQTLAEISSKLSSNQPPPPPSQSAAAAPLQTQPESLIQLLPPTLFASPLSKTQNPTSHNYGQVANNRTDTHLPSLSSTAATHSPVIKTASKTIQPAIVFPFPHLLNPPAPISPLFTSSSRAPAPPPTSSSTAPSSTPIPISNSVFAYSFVKPYDSTLPYPPYPSTVPYFGSSTQQQKVPQSELHFHLDNSDALARRSSKIAHHNPNDKPASESKIPVLEAELLKLLDAVGSRANSFIDDFLLQVSVANAVFGIECSQTLGPVRIYHKELSFSFDEKVMVIMGFKTQQSPLEIFINQLETINNDSLHAAYLDDGIQMQFEWQNTFAIVQQHDHKLFDIMLEKDPKKISGKIIVFIFDPGGTFIVGRKNSRP